MSLSQDQRSAQTNSGEEMVHGALGDRGGGRRAALRVHLHRDVLHLYIVLGLQNLLCVWIHAAR